MKKQIFILGLFVLALFASVNKSYGQLAPRAITCLPGDALHPIPGTPYDYQVDVPTPGGNKTYQWLVTTDQEFIENKVLVANPETPGATSKFLADAGAQYNQVNAKTTPNAATDKISLTWKSFLHDAANPVFVVINVINDDGTCSPNNLKVYLIKPIHAFTLDIDNRLPNNTALSTPGYGANIDRCISSIVSANYSPSDEKVIYDFGQDSLYFVVAAANWSGAWKPSVKVEDLATGENVTRVVWSSDPAAAWDAWEPMTLNSGEYVADGFVEPATAGTTVGASGEVIYIKVVLDHSDMTNPSFEGLVAEKVKVSVNGELFRWDASLATPAYVSTSHFDVHHDNGAVKVPCDALVEADYDDIAYQTLLPRPAVNTPATGFTPGLLPVKP